MEETRKILHYIDAENIRKLVNLANKLAILREDIVSILKCGDNYIMTYFR